MEKPGRRQSLSVTKLRGTALILLFVLIFGLLGAIPSAHADPHAVFYTAVGQQQLFFNILAALDQADYVEPADEDDSFSRESLLDKRTEAGFEAQSDDALDATKTDLAAVVTRNITLEGNDLWTAYQLQQSSLEKARRNYTDELVRVFCERALGRAACSTEAGPLQDQDTAFVTSAQNQAAQIEIGIGAAMNSGMSTDQNLRSKAADTTDSDAPNYILPFDSNLAALRENATTDTQQAAVNHLSTWPQTDSAIDPNLFDYLVEDDETGEITLSDSAPDDEIFHKLTQLANAPTSFLSSAISAGDQVASQLSTEQQDGAKADTEKVIATGSTSGTVAGVSTANAAGANGVYYRTISREITTPASAKIAMLGELAGTLSREVTDLKYANSEIGDTPGSQQLVDRGSSDSGTVQGIRSDQTSEGSESGEVAGIFDVIAGLYNGLYDFYDEPKTDLSPNVSAIDPKLESGSRAALLALTNDTFRHDEATNDSCGFCVSVDDIWSSIQNSLGDAFCSLFPDQCSS